MTQPERFQAVILAGGLGTRLRSVVADLPKVMAPVAGKPFLHHILQSLARQNFGRVVLAVGYKREVIMNSIGNNFLGMEIRYSIEEELLGTGGAIRQAFGFVEPGLCFVLNGDTWLELDYAAMYQEHQAVNARLTMAVKEIDDVSRFGTLQIHGCCISAFVEKGKHGSGTINAGVYLMPTELLNDQTLPRVFSLEQDFFVPALSDLRPLAYRATGEFIDIGIPADYARANTLLRASCARMGDVMPNPNSDTLK